MRIEKQNKTKIKQKNIEQKQIPLATSSAATASGNVIKLACTCQSAWRFSISSALQLLFMDSSTTYLYFNTIIKGKKREERRMKASQIPDSKRKECG